MKKTIAYVYANNQVYRQKMQEKGIVPEDIRSLDDLKQLPFITKEDFRNHYPLGMCCVEKSSLREIHMSSGSTGIPVVNAYTDHDRKQWAECMARCYAMAGLEPGDTIQITPSFGLFNGGFGFFHGAAHHGLFVIPTGAGNTPRQVRLMNDFGVKAFGAVVSYALRIIEYMEENAIETIPSLKIGIFGAEIFSDSMRQKIEAALGIETFDIFGMTETGGVGTTGMDCPDHSGIHVWEDHYIVEVVDPETGELVEDGQEGELVFTSLTREAIPVIRLRTSDASRILSREQCACGRIHTRIDRIKGRLDDMLIIKGVNVYPKEIEHALLEIPGVRNHYQIIVEEEDGIQDVTVHVEVEPGVTGFTVEKHLKEALGFSPKGDVFPPNTLPRNEGKQQRVVFKKK
ncbi:MAG: phenylacetate--CoA ligase [Bacteroidales bacterium]|nr:phenylacetate--CoA ligase [Bacteroidales bacterium]